MSMWVETAHGARDIESDFSLSVEHEDSPQGVRTWYVVSRRHGRGATVLQKGYRSDNEARNALDEFLSGHGITVGAFPRPEADDENDEVEEADTDDGGVDRGSKVGKAPAVSKE